MNTPTLSTDHAISQSKSKLSRLLFLILSLCGIVACMALISFEESLFSDHYLIHYGSRLGTVFFSLIVWFTTQAMIQNRKISGNRIFDYLHVISAPLHRYFLSDKRRSDIILIISSLFIDIFGVFIVLVSIFGTSMRPFIALLILFGLRQLFQGICALPIPDGMIWYGPGFPSLLVTYNVENDFYFSGHTSIAFLAALVSFTINPWLGAIVFVVAIMEALIVVVFRAHYTMDVFTAVLAAFVSFSLSGWILNLS